MKLLVQCHTRAGTFYIGQSDDGRFHPIYDGESYGSYAQAWQAAEDLAMNATYSITHHTTGALLDTSRLGIPADPREWERVN